MECSSIVILFEYTLYYMIVEELICLVYLDLPVERFIVVYICALRALTHKDRSPMELTRKDRAHKDRPR